MFQPTPISRTRRRPSLGMLLMVIALFLSFPAGVVASHLFADVPDSNTFHDNITNLYNARITTGCGLGIYCPGDAVTRGQMAGFLNRGLGRATSDDGAILMDGDGFATLASVTIHTGGATDGTGFVYLSGTAGFWVATDGRCPCTVGMSLENTTGRTTWTSVPDIDTPSDIGPNTKWESLSNSVVVPVNSNTEYTFTMRVHIRATTDADNAFSWYGDLSAVYVPFGWNGSNALLD